MWKWHHNFVKPMTDGVLPTWSWHLIEKPHIRGCEATESDANFTLIAILISYWSYHYNMHWRSNDVRILHIPKSTYGHASYSNLNHLWFVNCIAETRSIYLSCICRVVFRFQILKGKSPPPSIQYLRNEGAQSIEQEEFECCITFCQMWGDLYPPISKLGRQVVC